MKNFFVVPAPIAVRLLIFVKSRLLFDANSLSYTLSNYNTLLSKDE